jgi:hypothetical protein
LADRLTVYVAIRRFHGMSVADSRSSRSESYVRMTEFVRRSTSYVPFRRFLGYVRRESMQRLHVVLHGTLISYLCDDYQEDCGDSIACLHDPRG